MAVIQAVSELLASNFFCNCWSMVGNPVAKGLADNFCKGTALPVSLITQGSHNIIFRSE
jgi:hypothetical protein